MNPGHIDAGAVGPLGAGDAEAELAEMDADGIAVRLLIALCRGERGRTGSLAVSHEQVAARVAAAPDRFRGIWGFGPDDGWRGARAFGHAAADGTFVAAHVAPSSFDLAPDDRRLYPLYSKCAELELPVLIDVGSRRPAAGEPAVRDRDRPETLDTIACDLPSLTIVALGTGWPWVDELVAVANKHHGIHVAVTGRDLPDWPPALAHFARTWGSGKVMLASVGSPDRSGPFRSVAMSELPDAVRRALLSETARRVLLPEGRGPR